MLLEVCKNWICSRNRRTGGLSKPSVRGQINFRSASLLKFELATQIRRGDWKSAKKLRRLMWLFFAEKICYFLVRRELSKETWLSNYPISWHHPNPTQYFNLDIDALTMNTTFIKRKISFVHKVLVRNAFSGLVTLVFAAPSNWSSKRLVVWTNTVLWKFPGRCSFCFWSSRWSKVGKMMSVLFVFVFVFS